MSVRQSQLQLSVQRLTSHLNKWNGPQKVKCGASLNIKPRITDEMEARSCFINSQPQSSSPRSLSGSLGTLPTRSINTHCRLFFVKKRLEETINTHDKMPGCGMCSSAKKWCTDTFSSCAACFPHELQQMMIPSPLGKRIRVQVEQQYKSEIWLNCWWKCYLFIKALYKMIWATFLHGRDGCCSSAPQERLWSLVPCWAGRTERVFKAFFSPEIGAHSGQVISEIGV